MATFTTFEDIEAWKRAHQVALEIYRLTLQKGLDKDFALRDQMRRCAISITSNIAEGFDRRGGKEFEYFLSISKGSGAELRSQLILARDLNYVSRDRFEALNRELTEVNRMIGGLMKYLRQKRTENRNS